MGKRSRSKRGRGPRAAAAAQADKAALIRERAAERARPVEAPPPAHKPPARQPLPHAQAVATPARGFWRGFELPWAKLVVFRFVYFGLLSVDAWQQLPHAPRYGAGGFNVQHLPGAPLPELGRPGMTFLYAALCVLFALIAQGVLVRALLPLSALLYGYAYFVSQLDSYQHHYLVWLLLVLMCFVPSRPDPLPAGAAPRATRYVRSWALRLVLVQLAILYFYAAVAKMDPLWLDGATLAKQVRPGWIRDVLSSIGWYAVSLGVLAAELFLAASVWWRRLWPYALVVGVGLHIGIELVGLEIGLFSYLMLALYLLLVPDRAFVALARVGRAIAERWQRVPPVARLAGAIAVTVFALVRLIAGVPLVSGVLVALLIVALVAVVVATATWGDRRALARRIGAIGIAALVPVALDVVTDAAEDYHRFWAGASRRLGNEAEARRAYAGLLDVDASSEYANFHLGEAELRAGNLDRALNHYRAAQRGRPGAARAFVGEAMVHVRQQDRDAARAALETALRLEPGNAQAQQLLGQLNTDVPAEAIPPPAPVPEAHDTDR